MKLSAYRRILLASYVVVLLGVTLAPVPGTAYPPSGFDKLVHIVLFAGLAFLLHWNLHTGSTLTAAAGAIVLTMGVAALIEGVQGVLPFRNADEWDFVAGAAGAILGVACSAALGSFRRAPGSPADSAG
jgi:VanZ family protein